MSFAPGDGFRPGADGQAEARRTQTQGPVAHACAGAADAWRGSRSIVVETTKGTFEFETYPNEAPRTVEHILALVKKNFYNGLRFHRVEPGFVIQVGDPNTRDYTKKALWGTSGSGTPVGLVGAVAQAPARERRGGHGPLGQSRHRPTRSGT